MEICAFLTLGVVTVYATRLHFPTDPSYFIGSIPRSGTPTVVLGRDHCRRTFGSVPQSVCRQVGITFLSVPPLNGWTESYLLPVNPGRAMYGHAHRPKVLFRRCDTSLGRFPGVRGTAKGTRPVAFPSGLIY